MNSHEVSFIKENGGPLFAQTVIMLESPTLVKCPGKSRKQARTNLIAECLRRLKIHGEKKRRNKAYRWELKIELEKLEHLEQYDRKTIKKKRQHQNWIPRPIREGRIEITFELADDINSKRQILGWGIPKLSTESGIPQGTLTSILSLTVSSTDKRNLAKIFNALEKGRKRISSQGREVKI